jgi:hypothetical protein
MKTIVAKYQEDVSWTSQLPGEVIVINKDANDHRWSYNLPNDEGRECSSYLDYIVNNYDNLAGDYLFTQGRCEDQAPNLVAEVLQGKKYFGTIHQCDATGAPHINAPLVSYSLFLGLEPRSTYKFKGGAFMKLTAEELKSHPKEFYQLMLRVCQRDPISSHCYERLWPVIFPALANEL